MQIITKESYIGTITKEPDNYVIGLTFPHGKEVEFSSHEYKQGYKEHIAGHGVTLKLYKQDVGFTNKKIVNTTVSTTYEVLK